MRLDEFVKETILQIAKGVQDADKRLSAASSQAKIMREMADWVAAHHIDKAF